MKIGYILLTALTSFSLASCVKSEGYYTVLVQVPLVKKIGTEGESGDQGFVQTGGSSSNGLYIINETNKPMEFGNYTLWQGNAIFLSDTKNDAISLQTVKSYIKDKGYKTYRVGGTSDAIIIVRSAE